MSLAPLLAAAGLPEDAWESRRLAAGEGLFAAGDPADAFYVVEAGTVEAFLADPEGQVVVLERLAPGASFGELALLDGGRRTAGIRALTDARLRLLRREVFQDTLAASPAIAGALLALVGGRLRRNLRHLDYLIAWAGLVADGRYDEAQAAMARAADGADGDTDRFIDTFTTMVAAVKGRERALAGELAALRVEVDQARRAREVAEITETDFFRSLAAEAARLRARRGAGPAAEPPPELGA